MGREQRRGVGRVVDLARQSVGASSQRSALHQVPREAGPCSKSKGRPEPSKCQSSCTHRLEEAFLREDVDGAIRDALAAYETANADEESLTAAHWAAQVRAHVPRFADLQVKWMLNETVQALVGNEQGKVTE